MPGREFRIQDYPATAQDAYRRACDAQKKILENVLRRGDSVVEVTRMGMIKIQGNGGFQCITPTGQLTMW